MSSGIAPTTAAVVLDALATSVLLVAGNNRIIWINVAASDLLAVGRNAAAGRRLPELMLEGASLEALVGRARATGEALVQRGLEISPTGRNDTRHLADVLIKPMSGAPGTILVEIADTTRQARMERESALLAQQGGSRAMARQLAHEIKNPLGGLRGAAQLLERELPTDELREYTRVIIGEADRLRALVDSLLGPARPIQRVAMNPHELVDHVYRLARAEAPAGVSVERDYDPSLPMLEIDRDLMVQAMLNLARNALQALGDSGKLTLRTRVLTQATIGAERHRVVAAVQFEDSGPGVPEHLGETIFYPLVTSRPGGTGLGLALAQDIVTRHGGLIEFDSRPGRTVFSVLLPAGGDHDAVA